MASVAPLVIERRRDATAPSGVRSMAVIACRKCKATDETVVTTTAGWAKRVFSQRGWKVGERPGQHLCPTCNRKRSLTDHSSLDATTGASLAHTDDTGMTIYADRIPPHDVTVPFGRLADMPATNPSTKDTPTIGEIAAAAAHLGEVKIVSNASLTPGTMRGPGVTVVNIGETPVARALSYARPMTAPARDGERQKTFASAGHTRAWSAANSAKGYLRAIGVERPEAGVHFTVFHEPEGWAWKLIPPPEETPVTAIPPSTFRSGSEEAVAIMKDVPMTADAPRSPTRPEIRAVQDALDTHYDVDKQRYRGDQSDARVADALGYPRAWVAAERERAYGPEGNAAAEVALDKWRRDLSIQAGKLADEALKLAAAAESLKAAISAGPKA